ncbi:uncharacterized protein [Parasteatoda tepidariorum]|uniref:uncharacterized protein n=1 Tax=Parasteatoda tepidariorum TaxID=114398 RepID=UPI0039BD6DC8
MNTEEKFVYRKFTYKSPFMRRGVELILKEQGYNCTHENMYSRRCQTMWIEIVFDGFDVTNMTYNAKYESLELFSVIGGYMGMYLGFSIVTVYDFAEIVMRRVYTFWRNQTSSKADSPISVYGESAALGIIISLYCILCTHLLENSF